jgi:hypothetical protein
MTRVLARWDGPGTTMLIRAGCNWYLWVNTAQAALSADFFTPRVRAGQDLGMNAVNTVAVDRCNSRYWRITEKVCHSCAKERSVGYRFHGGAARS